MITLVACSNTAFSGGPLVIQGAAGNTPVKYQNPAITVNVEAGDLGTTSNTDANMLLQEALDLWNNVSTSALNMSVDTTAITTDIDENNFTTVLPGVNGGAQNNNDNLNPVIYDSNGAIIDAFFGNGASDNTLGFAASFFSIGGDFFSEGFAVINGRDLGITNTDFILLITHEIGHFTGLDHSQININNQENISGLPFICLSTMASNYPVMYPFICRDSSSLHLDDEISLSSLYPAADIDNNLGILQGNLVNLAGDAILGANVFAVKTTTGEAVSSVSDYLLQDTGFYKLYLPAGNYKLHANSINTLFNGGSSIGPYADTILSESFTTPHPITETIYQDAVTNDDAIITIVSNQTVAFNFVLDVTVNEVDNTNNTDTGGSGGGSNKILGAPSFITLLLLLGLLATTRRLFFCSAKQARLL
ncbi:MAG: hypothetical protein JKX75_03100 [Gammaproteobacteria bacterium]|nr:hypothetical protein [Gammaproteobacteria bacterium]